MKKKNRVINVEFYNKDNVRMCVVYCKNKSKFVADIRNEIMNVLESDGKFLSVHDPYMISCAKDYDSKQDYDYYLIKKDDISKVEIREYYYA